MAITKEEIEQARQETRNERNQRRMEKELNIPSPPPAPTPPPPVKKAKGGTASSRADGCAQRGKTRGTMV